MAEEPQFSKTVPTKQRDLPTLEEALQENPENPRPLTINEYRARQQKKPQRIKLLQQRRLVNDMTKSAKDEESRQRYIESLQEIEAKLRKGAKQRKRAA